MNEGMIRELPREGRLTRSIPRDLERALRFRGYRFSSRPPSRSFRWKFLLHEWAERGINGGVSSVSSDWFQFLQRRDANYLLGVNL